MNSDQKIKMVKEIVNDEESTSSIIGPLCYNSQSIKFTKVGRQHIGKMFSSGNLSNPLKDCTIVVKIENSKALVCVVRDGITICTFKPVHPEFMVTTFEFKGVSIPFEFKGASIPFELGW